MIKKFLAAGAVLVSLTACGGAVDSYDNVPPSDNYSGIDVGDQDGEVFYMTVPDGSGTEIPCIVYNAAHDGGGAISCNWTVPTP